MQDDRGSKGIFDKGALERRARASYLRRPDRDLERVMREVGIPEQTARAFRDDGNWDKLLDNEIQRKNIREVGRVQREIALANSQLDATYAGLIRRVLRAIDRLDKDGKALAADAKPELRVGEGMWILLRLLADRRVLINDMAESVVEGWPRLDPEYMSLTIATRPRGELPVAPPPTGKDDPSDTALEILERSGAANLLVFPPKGRDDDEEA